MKTKKASITVKEALTLILYLAILTAVAIAVILIINKMA